MTKTQERERVVVTQTDPVDELARRMYFASLPKDGKRTWSKLSDASKRPFLRMASSILDNPDPWIRLFPWPDHDPRVRHHLAAIHAEAAQGETGFDRGTPEMRAKKTRTKKADVFGNLIRDENGKGQLTNHQANAGKEIREIFEVISRKMETPAVDPSKEPVDTSMGDFIPPLAQIPPHLEKAYHGHYLVWAREARKRTYGRRRITAYAITVDVVVYNKGISDLEKRHGLRRGHTVFKALRDALTLYAWHAGWIGGTGKGRTDLTKGAS